MNEEAWKKERKELRAIIAMLQYEYKRKNVDDPRSAHNYLRRGCRRSQAQMCSSSCRIAEALSVKNDGELKVGDTVKHLASPAISGSIVKSNEEGVWVMVHRNALPIGPFPSNQLIKVPT